MVEGGGAVDVPLVLHGEARCVLGAGVAEVRVTRAVRDVDDGVVGERVAASAKSKTPPSPIGPSATVVWYRSRSGAHVSAEKQTPPS